MAKQQLKTAPAPTHSPDHFFKGVCICPCKNCTTHPDKHTTRCICPDCPPELCGI